LYTNVRLSEVHVPEEFTDHQWQRLVDAGPQIARAVAASAGSSGQSEVELGAFLRLVDEAADDDNSSVLGRLAAAARDKVAAGMLTGTTEDAIPDGIQAAREAGAILSVAAIESDARTIRQWLLQAAHVTAAAAREGGVFGIGGTDVSDRERDTMGAISDALGGGGSSDMSRGDAPAEQSDDQLDDQPADEPAETELGPDGQPIGADNIRDGTVRGTMSGPGAQEGEGQGG
jgi:hypothetical protein